MSDDVKAPDETPAPEPTAPPPPEPDPVGSPFSPVPKVQCPAVTTMVGLTSVPEQLNQPPESSNRGSIAVGS